MCTISDRADNFHYFAAMRTISDRADDTAHVDFPLFVQTVASRYAEHMVQPERAGRGFKESARASGATKFAPAP
eukprot:gene44507-55363_t